MTDHLTELRDRHVAEAEMFSAAPSRAKFHQDTADALTALIKAREKLVRMEGQMHEVEAGDMSTYEVLDEIDAALAAIAALGKETLG